MQWIHDYDLFLFDFDGLLVNTEELHFRAYKQMCDRFGFDLDWSFQQYAEIAHISSQGLREEIYKKFPGLAASYPHWDELYQEKTLSYLDLLRRGQVQLMPGAGEFLHEIVKRNKKTCVVTNSSRQMVEAIIDCHPALQLIDVWVTREDYDKPKPDPECYIKAIKEFISTEGKAIGFEDSPRGLQALLNSDAAAVLITEIEYPTLYELMDERVRRFHSFTDLLLSTRL